MSNQLVQYYQLSTFLRRWLFDTYVRKFTLVCNLQDSYNLQAMSFEHVDLCIILYILTLQFKSGVSYWSIFANKQWTVYLLVYLSCVDPDEMPGFVAIHLDLHGCVLNLTVSFLQGTRPKSYYEPLHEISNNVLCATSKGSDQPAHTHSLIRAFARRLNILWLLCYWLKIIWSL